MRRLLLLVVLLAGCTNQLAVRQAELNRFIGRPELELVQSLGVPTRSFDTGGLRFLSYEERRVDIVPTSPFMYNPYPFGYGGGFPPEVINLVCDTTFTVEKGIVRAYALRGNACG